MENKLTLQGIVLYMSALEEKIIENLGEITEEESKALVDLENKLQVKVDGYHGIMESIDLRISLYKAKAETFSKIATALAKHKDNLKDSILIAMDRMNTDRLEGEDFMFRKQYAKDKVIVEDESLVPAVYKEVVQTYKLRKDIVSEEIKNGAQIPGVRLERSPYLRAYVKGVK